MLGVAILKRASETTDASTSAVVYNDIFKVVFFVNNEASDS